jgi:flagellar biosynthetic protein FliR
MLTIPNLESTILAMAFVGLRISGLLVFAPFFSNAAIAPRIKVGLTVALTALLYPVCGSRGLMLTQGGLLKVGLAETMIGLLIGLAVQLVLEAAQLGGQLMGFQVGFSLVNIIDPTTQVDTPVLSLFSETVTLLLFLAMDIHHWLLRGVAASFTYLPAGAGLGQGAVVNELFHAAAGIWLAGVQIAAPLLLATLMIDFVLGFLGKASPQLPALFLGLSLKSMVGLAALAFSLKFWPGLLGRYFTLSIHWSERMLHLAV